MRILAVTKRRRRRKSAESPGGNGGIYFERAPAALSGLGGNVGGGVSGGWAGLVVARSTPPARRGRQLAGPELLNYVS